MIIRRGILNAGLNSQILVSVPVYTSTSAPPYLDDVTDSVVADLDVTVSGSYDGTGGVWNNLIATPADGELQTEYDMYLGSSAEASANDPGFNGDPHTQEAYWGMDGDAYFSQVNAVSAQPSTISYMATPTTISDFWTCVCFRTPDALDSNFIIWANGAVDGNIGISLAYLGPGTKTLKYSHFAEGTNAQCDTAIELTPNTDYCIVTSMDTDGGAGLNVRTWVNSSTKVEDSLPFISTNTKTDGIMRVGTGDNNGTPTAAAMRNNTRMYHFSMGRHFIDDVSAGEIIGHLEARHGRDYTP